jgi:hypothetical protein
MQEELGEEYMGWYAPGQVMNYPLYRQLAYHISVSNDFKLKHRHTPKQFRVEMKGTRGKNTAAHLNRPAEVIPASLVWLSYWTLLFSILKLRRCLMKLSDWWIQWLVRKRLTMYQCEFWLSESEVVYST